MLGRPIARSLSSPLARPTGVALPWESGGEPALPTWDPSLLSASGLWRTDPWELSIGTTGLATQINDLSANGRHLLKAASGTAPPFSWTSEFAGEVAVDFTYTPSLRALFTTIPQPFTVAVVLTVDRTTSQVVFDSANATTNAFLWVNGGAPSRFEMRAGATLTGTVTTVAMATKYLAVAEFNGASSKLWINGTLEASGNAGTNGLADGFTLGASRTATPGTPLDGRVPFCAVVPRVLTADERNAIGKYVAQWYGITVAGAAVPPGYSAITAAPTWDIVLVAGQSNASGDSDGGALSAQSGYATQYPIPHIYNVNGSAAGPTFTKEQATDIYSAEIAIARRAIEAERRVALVKVSQGSTHLAAGAGSDWSPSSVGELYDTLIARVGVLTATITRYRIAGMLWIQGEADATVEAEANAYQANLADLFANLRTDLVAPSLRAGVVRLHQDWDGTSYTLAYFATTRAAQTAFVAADGNATLIDQDTQDLILIANGYLVDDAIHLGAPGRLANGQLFATALGIL